MIQVQEVVWEVNQAFGKAATDDITGDESRDDTTHLVGLFQMMLRNSLLIVVVNIHRLLLLNQMILALKETANNQRHGMSWGLERSCVDHHLSVAIMTIAAMKKTTLWLVVPVSSLVWVWQVVVEEKVLGEVQGREGWGHGEQGRGGHGGRVCGEIGTTATVDQKNIS